MLAKLRAVGACVLLTGMSCFNPSFAQGLGQITPEQIAGICRGIDATVSSGGRGTVSQDGVNVQIDANKEFKLSRSNSESQIASLTYTGYTQCVLDLSRLFLSSPRSELEELQRLKREADDRIRRRIELIPFVASSNPHCHTLISRIQMLVSPVNIQPDFARPVNPSEVSQEQMRLMLLDARNRIYQNEIAMNYALDGVVSEARGNGCLRF